MARYSDEEWEYRQDVRDKSITARSARRTRTHNDKSGPVKFPSDYLTAKERKAMNGECKSWNMNKPMTWAEFKEMPDDLKGNYIKMLRQRFNVPDKCIAEMLGVSRSRLCLYFRDLHLGLGKEAGASHHKWDKEGFEIWWHGEKTNDEATEESIDITSEEPTPENTPDEPMEAVEAANIFNRPFVIKDVESLLGDTEDCQRKFKPIIPESGTMTFSGTADDILETFKGMLCNSNVILTVSWTVDQNVDVKEE